jgi:LysM repeat protein
VRRGDWRRFVAPAAFLLAATVAVLLIRSGLHSSTTATTTTSAVPAAPTKTVGAVTNTTKAKKPRAPARFYTVQAGDTFGVISTKTGVAVATIEQLNPNISSTSLFIGEKVRIR